ncbi:hypothetical protein OHV45_17790 [Acinetobacter baumannii]|nr:hypothetical protein [Acinetobacter baumannii]
MSKITGREEDVEALKDLKEKFTDLQLKIEQVNAIKRRKINNF